jgi:hypothetical protein
MVRGYGFGGTTEVRWRVDAGNVGSNPEKKKRNEQ